MKIQIFSDLHLEFLEELPTLKLPPVDLVILAGDIHIGVQGIRWAKQTFGDVPAVVYVMGNHEFYGGDLIETIAQARVEAAGSNVHLLENDCLELTDVTILGCTLWTDFRLLREDHQNFCKRRARTFMTDYSAINLSWRKADPDDTQRVSEASRQWLSQQIQKAKKPTIVVTHHGPIIQTLNPDYDLDEITANFNNNYTDLLLSPVKLWVWGHTHHCADFVHKGIRFISNQKGYPRETLKGFSWGTVFDVSL